MAERYVFVHLPQGVHAVPAGRLVLFEQGVRTEGSRFSYGVRYLQRANAIALDPASLPLDASTDAAPANRLLMFGAFRDVTPDFWGRRVIENRLRVPPDSLPESRYMDLAGSNRSGALDFRPGLDSPPIDGKLPPVMALEHLIDAAARVEEGEPVPAHLDVFFEGSPLVGGARPKAVLEHAGREWVAKFPSVRDRFDVPLVEYATLRLARQAGLDVPALELRTLADGRHVMLIERFDRGPREAGVAERRHMVSALTMLARHESESANASYAEIAHAISTRGVSGEIARDRAELFGRMVFNLLVSNDDDHLRNHAFLYEAGAAGWRLSPLFDVVPKPQIAHDRWLHLSVGPQGRAARLDNAMRGAGAFGLLPAAAAAIADRIVRTIREWRGYFETWGISPGECDRVASAFRRPADIGLREVERVLKS
jgi:serine/threonine-protein kinase HipA